MLFRDLNRVADVVAMAVAAQHDVHFLYFLLGFWTRWIALQPRINQDRFPARSLYPKRRVTQPGEFCPVQIHGDFILMAWEMTGKHHQ